MPISFFVYPWKSGSRSARALATALGGRVLRRENSRFIPRENRKVINWGASDCPWECLNANAWVSSNKLTMLSSWLPPHHNPLPRTPRWTVNRLQALEWDFPVLARSVLNGHSGVGIVYKDADNLEELPEAPLYVEYIPKDSEYRVHVFNNEVIDVQRKVRDPDREVTDWKVRSHRNGFIFVRHDREVRSYRDIVPNDVLEQARRAMACSGLTFGGVDVVWNQHREAAFVLEVNSAVGLSPETTQNYATAIRRYYDTAP